MSVRRTRGLSAAAVAVLIFSGVATSVLPASGAAPRRVSPNWSFQGEHVDLNEFDARAASIAPSAGQRAAARRMGAEVDWNRFGTPHSVINYNGALATGLTGRPAEAARSWLRDNRALFRLSEGAVADLELVAANPIGAGHAVLFRQTYDGVPAARDGMVTLALKGGRLLYVSSSLSGDTTVTNERALSAAQALRAGAEAAGRSISADDMEAEGTTAGWTRFDVKGFTHPLQSRVGALPTPRAGVRLVYENSIIDNEPEPLAYANFVDAETGEVLYQEAQIDWLAPESPEWRVFPNTPPQSYSSADTRELWCWTSTEGCARAIGSEAPDGHPEWDINTGSGPPNTSLGNNARTFDNWNSNDPFSVGRRPATRSQTRDYEYAWTNQWYTASCDPAVFRTPQENDRDAAIANLFAMHNRMHDWSYHLGFTEATWNLQEDQIGPGGLGNDPEQGNAQAGGITGGPPGYAARDNANQITPSDGIAPITNMYLWQPIPGGFYAPCVDGDYDMTVVGHEYTHAISNRMVAGPNGRLAGGQSGAMGESWSDLTAVEYLLEYGFAPVAGENPFAVGPYVTSDPVAGIRNYGMNRSPLNYSNVGYDITGPQVHADGEIWSATNYDIRQAMIARYGAGSGTGQVACANGEVPADQCPGNRRWMQIVFDAYLVPATGAVSMVDMRNAYLVADQMRFGGANQDLLWNAFAARGLGENAASAGNNDGDPRPSFESPFADEATVTFKAVGSGGGDILGARLFVGHYEARSTAIADTDPQTATTDTFRIVPGSYDFIIQAPGYGVTRVTRTLAAGDAVNAAFVLEPNLASSAHGATATGDGTGQGFLIDDTEATNWASLGSPVAGKEVTVRLDPSQPFHDIERVQVSALLRPVPPNQTTDPPQNRFSALRSFEIWACQVTGAVDCSQDSQFAKVFTSPADAFPSVAPRPRAPDMITRAFTIPRTRATHVRLVVLTNQCTGAPDFQQDDNDPRHNPVCATGSVQALNVRASELQVFRR